MVMATGMVAMAISTTGILRKKKCLSGRNFFLFCKVQPRNPEQAFEKDFTRFWNQTRGH
jgi:hypothetical protein